MVVVGVVRRCECSDADRFNARVGAAVCVHEVAGGVRVSHRTRWVGVRLCVAGSGGCSGWNVCLWLCAVTGEYCRCVCVLCVVCVSGMSGVGDCEWMRGWRRDEAGRNGPGEGGCAAAGPMSQWGSAPIPRTLLHRAIAINRSTPTTHKSTRNKHTYDGEVAMASTLTMREKRAGEKRHGLAGFFVLDSNPTPQPALAID